MMTDTRRRVTLALIVAIGLLATRPVVAQNSRWATPYQQALKAIQSGDYAQAAQLLERAVAADPKSEANKRIEGVFRVDYFPYYYLGIAYFEMQEYEKARANLNKARPTLGRQLLPKLDEYEKRTAAEIERRRTNPEFERAARAAEASLTAKRFAEAVSSLDAARAADLGEFTKQNLQTKREEAVRGLRGQQLTDEAQQLLQRSHLAAARTKFMQAEEALPGQPVVQEGLEQIRQRQATYQRLLAAADQDVRTSNFQAALDKYGQARTIDPDQSTADNLESRIKLAGDRMAVKADTRAKAPEPPRDLPPPSTDQNSARTALRDALTALFEGNADRSIAILEPAVSGRANQGAASLHAYLGVAYATRALSLPADDEPARIWREKAIAEFRLAVKSQRDYQLSARVVSPKILALFEQARTN
jgi:tetratricopeptide (TPR) repeat protein